MTRNMVRRRQPITLHSAGSALGGDVSRQPRRQRYLIGKGQAAIDVLFAGAVLYANPPHIARRQKFQREAQLGILPRGHEFTARIYRDRRAREIPMIAEKTQEFVK